MTFSHCNYSSFVTYCYVFRGISLRKVSSPQVEMIFEVHSVTVFDSIDYHSVAYNFPFVSLVCMCRLCVYIYNAQHLQPKQSRGASVG